MEHLILTDPDGGRAVLTTNSPASSYGIPVLRITADDIEGDFGPSDLIGQPGALMPAAAVVAAWARDSARTEPELSAAAKFLRQWPEGPQVEG
ncbi:MAG: hypothetical protein IH602_15035 [Bryobacteraceae bacterium]|nr:hypothetical protein [Bryobacteraceae bacterium]